GHRLVGRRPWLALAMALAGTALALGGIPAGAVPPLSGLIQVILSPIIYAAWIVLSARLSGETSERVGGEAQDGADTAAATALMMVASAVGFWSLAIVTARPVLPMEIPSAAWPGIVGIGLISTFVAIQTFYGGAQRIGAAQASLISTFEPIWTVSLAAILLDERLGPVQLIGGALVIGGVILAQTSSSISRPGVTLRVADE
ncbi:MAG: DMT family transporter, partial [Chloroflexota bacterium]|nr:DMT family transporter [Chloroflexota bacterium]